MAQKTDLLFLLILGSSPALAAVPDTLTFQPGVSDVQFTAIGRPSLLRIKGEGAHAAGALQAKGGNYAGEITVDLNEFQTGIAMRDRHMKEKYLELGKTEFAKALLKVIKLEESCVAESSKGAKVCAFDGMLSFHGKTQPMSGTARVKDDSGSKNFEVEWTLKLSDYDVSIPQFAGITVADQVEIRAQAKTNEKTP